MSTGGLIVAGGAMLALAAAAATAKGEEQERDRSGGEAMGGGVVDVVRRFGDHWGWPKVVQKLAIAASYTEAGLDPRAFLGTTPPPGYAQFIEPILGPIFVRAGASAEQRANETAAATKQWERNKSRFAECGNNPADYKAGSMGAWGMLPVGGIKAFLGTKLACTNPVAMFLPQVGLICWYAYLASLQRYDSYDGTVLSGRAGFRSLWTMGHPDSDGFAHMRRNLVKAIDKTGVDLDPLDQLPVLDTSGATYERWGGDADIFLRAAGSPGIAAVDYQSELVKRVVLHSASPWSVEGQNFRGERLWREEGLTTTAAAEVAALEPLEGRAWTVGGPRAARDEMVELLQALGVPAVGLVAPARARPSRARPGQARTREARGAPGYRTRRQRGTMTRAAKRKAPARDQPSKKYRWTIFLWLTPIEPALRDQPKWDDLEWWETLTWRGPTSYDEVVGGLWVRAWIKVEEISPNPGPPEPPLVERSGIIVGSAQSMFALSDVERIMSEAWPVYGGEIDIWPRDLRLEVAQTLVYHLEKKLGVRATLRFL